MKTMLLKMTTTMMMMVDVLEVMMMMMMTTMKFQMATLAVWLELLFSKPPTWPPQSTLSAAKTFLICDWLTFLVT
jgi:hypothetical protein